MSSIRRLALAVGIVAAFVLAVIGVLAVVDDPVTLPRWVPTDADELTISYGAWSPVSLVYPGAEVALVTTPDDADTDTDDDWTVVRRFTISGFGFEPGIREYDGIATSTYPADEVQFAVRSARFDAAWLEDHQAELDAAGTELDAVAAVVAAWDADLEVVHAGAPMLFDVTVSSPGTGVASTPDTDPVQRRASFGGQLTADSIAEFFALETAPPLGSTYLIFEDIPIEDLSRGEWMNRLRTEIGKDPDVSVHWAEWWSFVFIDVDPLDEGWPRLDGAELERWHAADGTARLRLRFAEPRSERDGGGVTMTIGDNVRLTFEYMHPGVRYETLELGSRLYDEEAEFLLAAVNGARR